MARRKRHLALAEAEPSEVEQWAHTLKQNWLLCRELGHNWKPHTARFVTEYRAYERILKCPRCTAERHEVLDSTGSKVSSHLIYPKGYLHQGLGRIVGQSRDTVRLESLTRFITQTSSESA